MISGDSTVSMRPENTKTLLLSSDMVSVTTASVSGPRVATSIEVGASRWVRPSPFDMPRLNSSPTSVVISSTRGKAPTSYQRSPQNAF